MLKFVAVACALVIATSAHAHSRRHAPLACPAGYTLVNGECINPQKEKGDDGVVSACPEGFTVSRNGKKCVRPPTR